MIELALAKHVDSLDIGWTFDPDGPDGNVFMSFMPSGPDAALAIFPTGGDPNLSAVPIDMPNVQLMIRGAHEDPVDAKAKAEALYSALNCLDNVTLDEGGDDEAHVAGITALQSAPIPLGQDDNQRFGFTINLRLHVYTPTANRPAFT